MFENQYFDDSHDIHDQARLEICYVLLKSYDKKIIAQFMSRTLKCKTTYNLKT